MQALRIAAIVCIGIAGLEAQVPGRGAPRVVVPGGVPAGAGISSIPFVMFGVPGTPGVYGNPNVGWYWNSPGIRSYPYLYYWGLAGRQNNLPQGPSYANPAEVKPIDPQPAPLTAPSTANTAEWVDARASFTSASVKVSAARQAVEELRARLAAMGQSPRANLTAGVASADAALRSAQELMKTGDLENSLQEIQRANYLAAQVLKEFGR